MKIRFLKTLFFIQVIFLSLSFVERLPAQTKPHGGNFGLGIILGEPTGFTGKYWFRDRVIAGDMGITYSYAEFLLIYADALWHFPEAMKGMNPQLVQISPYIGGGLGIRISSRDKPKGGDARANAYLRIPLGMEWTPQSGPPLGIFGEVVPGMGFAPKVFGIIQGGIGIRYFF
jgi:hypothetical protein